MKNIFFSLAVCLFSLLDIALWANKDTDIPDDGNPTHSAAGVLNIACSPELNELTSSWVVAYTTLNPAVKISVSSTGMSQSKNAFYLATSEQAETMSGDQSWKMTIGHSAVVPLINAQNPLLSEIRKTGITSEKLKQLITDPNGGYWGSILNNESLEPVHFYYIANENIINTIASFINSEASMINGIMLQTEDELLEAIQNDIYAIGFCSLNDAGDIKTGYFKENTCLLPIDKNGNGRLDSFENIYSDLSSFTRGLWLGKYPADLCNDIYAVSGALPVDKTEIGFLTWIINDGQKFLNEKGYSTLVSSERTQNTNTLLSTTPELEETTQTGNSSLWLLILGGLILAGVIVTFIVRITSRKRQADPDKNLVITSALNENSIAAPQGLYFDKSHTWAFMERDGVVRIGVDDFLQHITGEITKVKMKAPGDYIRKGEVLLTIIRDGKQLNIYAPVTGTIKEFNPLLINDSSLINSSPYNDGWVYMIEPKNWLREIEFLFTGAHYKDWLSDEFSRLRDFFTASVRTNSSSYAHIVLQDGGELTDNVLAELEPQVWEDFQTKFLDSSK